MEIAMQEIHVAASRSSRKSWYYLLQKGFFLETVQGWSIRDFLESGLGLERDFVNARIRTIFLNSSPVDEIGSARIKQGDILALGGAMPGLVGICLGRESPFRSFRQDLDARPDSVAASPDTVLVTVKIFSTLAEDIGDELLKRGVLLSASDLSGFLRAQEPHLLAPVTDPVLLESISEDLVRLFVELR